MKKQRQVSNPVILRRGVGIGSGNAESDDEFLFDCFIDNPAAETALHVSHPGMVLVGRTGSGKTAILRHVEAKARQCAALDPFDMAMNYVANSDALRFLHAIGADLDLMFQALWKHILCIEFIRLRWEVDNAERSVSTFRKIAEFIQKDQRRSKALGYLKEWEGKFWITMDENVKELTEATERKIHAEIGGELSKFKAGGQYDKRLSVGKKSELVARVRKIISEDQLAELHGVIDAISVANNGDYRTYYILIDQLDERWVDDQIRFRMIKALLQSLRSFRKIPCLKILIALRADVLERVVLETSDISFQREKFEDYRITLLWSKSDLRDLVERRLNKLFKRQYTGSLIGFNDIFPARHGGRDTFDWMLERTLMRPRDIIAFVNECIDAADGQPSVNSNALKKAELEFARKRRDALVQEWKSAYPTLDKLLGSIVGDKKPSKSLGELAGENSVIDDFCLTICSSPQIDHDPLHAVCQAHVDGKSSDDFSVIQEAAAVLYRTGAIGIKLSPQDRFTYSHIDAPIVSPTLLTRETKIRLHPMLHAAYHLHDEQASR